MQDLRSAAGASPAGAGSFELSQRFHFDAAHTLVRDIGDPEARCASRRVHGHTYQAEVALRGQADPRTGMLLDLAVLRERIAAVRSLLDHRLLDEVPGLEQPTLEHLCLFIAARLREAGLPPAWVRVWREAGGDACLWHAG